MVASSAVNRRRRRYILATAIDPRETAIDLRADLAGGGRHFRTAEKECGCQAELAAEGRPLGRRPSGSTRTWPANTTAGRRFHVRAICEGRIEENSRPTRRTGGQVASRPDLGPTTQAERAVDFPRPHGRIERPAAAVAGYAPAGRIEAGTARRPERAPGRACVAQQHAIDARAGVRLETRRGRS